MNESKTSAYDLISGWIVVERMIGGGGGDKLNFFGFLAAQLYFPLNEYNQSK